MEGERWGFYHPALSLQFHNLPTDFSLHGFPTIHLEMSSTGPNIAAASIPNITVLREKLEYGDSRSDRCDAFNDDIRVFRKRYRTSSGLPGVDLYDWRSSEHQSALTEMANAYLEKEGNGSVYWPDDDTSPNHNGLQFSKDHQLYDTQLPFTTFN